MKPGKQLYQWDVNQFLIELQPTAEFVDYPMGNEVIRIKSDGTRCRIPDEVLQTYGGKTCYERYTDGTYRAYSFTVLYSPKPPDYVFTPEERTTFEALTARVDASIEEIKRRADSGEFTPVKGVDYFTDAEKNELMESVSTGAIGEFRKVVDTATTEYNANAAEKLEAYNQNHTAKVAEYNQNAETKTAEFDANAAALQTEVDRLRGECDNLAAENRKQENRISALMKLNKGQTYDILPEEGETASRTAPSGAKYVSVDKVGGKSVVWNQHVNGYSAVGITHTTSGGVVTITPTSSSNRFVAKENLDYISVVNGHKYLATVEIKSDGEHDHDVGFQNYLIGGVKKTNSATWTQLSVIVNATSTGRVYFQLYSTSNTAYQIKDGSFNVIDLTQMFGSTIANYIYSLEQSQAGAGVEWFKKLFPDDYYPYSEPTIISSQTDRVDVARADGTTSQHITTGFPALNSAGSVYDYIDLNEGKLHRRVGVIDLGTISWSKGGGNNKTSWVPVSWRTNVKPVQSTEILANILCNKYLTDTAKNVERQANDKTIAVNKAAWVYIYDSAYVNATPQEFKTAMSGVMLYYELAEELITAIEIPTELTDWLDVEAGGSVTFHDADESKQLAVPNAVSWVRKLNEVE